MVAAASIPYFQPNLDLPESEYNSWYYMPILYSRLLLDNDKRITSKL